MLDNKMDARIVSAENNAKRGSAKNFDSSPNFLKAFSTTSVTNLNVKGFDPNAVYMRRPGSPRMGDSINNIMFN